MADLRSRVAGYWRGEAGRGGRVLDIALAPFEAALGSAVAARNLGYDRDILHAERATVPVVSVGNLTVGGTGKTPFAAWVAARLAEAGRRPAVVLRGYGGDEIDVHRTLNPGIRVYARTDRRAAAAEAAHAGADCVVLDDGFQHRSLARDLDIVLVAAEQWSERRRLLPRGPWREPFPSIRRATQLVVTRKTAPRDAADAIASRALAVGFDRPIAIARLEPTTLEPIDGSGAAPLALERLSGASVVAVSTLADPRPFVGHLEAAGADVESVVFGDHHEFTLAEAAAIARRAEGRTCVVTLKEAVKLAPLLPDPANVFVLGQRVVVEAGEAELVDALSAPFGGA